MLLAQARVRIARRLRDTVRALMRELSAEYASMLLKDLNGSLNTMCSSTSPTERLGAVLVIFELADLPFRDESEKVVRFANYLR